MFSFNSKKLSRNQANASLSGCTGNLSASGGNARSWLPGILAGAAGVAIFAAASSGNIASASVVLSSNFNGSLDGWTVASTGSGSYISDNGSESAFTNIGGGASAHLVGGSSNVPTLTNTSLPGITGNDAVQISFDFNIQKSSSGTNDAFLLSGRNIILDFGSASSSTTTAGSLFYVNGGTGTTTTFAPSLDTWYRVILNLAPSGAASPTWGISVLDTSNSVLYSADNILFSHPMSGTSPYPYGSLQFTFNNPSSSSGGNFLVDNVNVVVVPEPAPLALLTIGLAGMALPLLRRRRKI